MSYCPNTLKHTSICHHAKGEGKQEAAIISTTLLCPPVYGVETLASRRKKTSYIDSAKRLICETKIYPKHISVSILCETILILFHKSFKFRIYVFACPHRSPPLLELSCSLLAHSDPVCSFLQSHPPRSPQVAAFVHLPPGLAEGQ